MSTANVGAKMNIKRALTVCLALWLAAAALTGCQAATARSERVGSGWSRGESLGQATLNTQVGMAVSPQGDQVALAWVREDRSSSQDKLHLVELNRAGEVRVDRDVEIETDRPEQVQIWLGQEGALHLFWLDGPRDARRLLYVQIDATGTPAASPAILSVFGASVDSYALEQDERGQIEAFWASREGQSTGIFRTRISPDGQVGTERQVLNSQGFAPTVRMDRDGRIHIVWYEEPGFNEYTLRYAIYDAARGSLGPVTDLASFPTGIGLAAHRPGLGLTNTDIYVFWSLERRGGGRTLPMAESYWLSFPIGQADRASRPRDVNVPSVNHPEHNTKAGGFNTGNWVLPMEDTLPATFVYLPATTRGQRETLPVAFSVELEGRTESIIQIILTLWAKGHMEGYQVAARTRSTSLRPVLIADQGENLHLAWIETAGFGRYDVFYASTSPEARANLDRIMLSDMGAAMMNLAWGVAQAISFLPIALVWAFLPLLVVSVYAFIRAEDDMARKGPRAALIIAIVLYAAFKYLFRPNWLAALPLPRGTPKNLAAVIIYVAPLIISILAGLATWFYVKRREAAFLFPTLAVFVGTDILLTLLIYVPSMLAE
jgi:hypothetical protein